MGCCRQRKGEQDGTAPEHSASGTPAGSDDTFSLLPDLGITITEELPNPRKYVANLQAHTILLARLWLLLVLCWMLFRL